MLHITYSFGRALDQNTYQFSNQTLSVRQFLSWRQSAIFSMDYRIIIQYRKNKYQVLASEQDLQNIKDNIALNVALAYLQILLNKELVAANENQLQITLQQIEKTKKLVDAGSVAKGNLLQIEAQAAQEELQLITMKNQLETSYSEYYSVILNLQTPDGFEIVVPEISVDTKFSYFRKY